MNKEQILTQVICAMINSGEMKVFAFEAKLDKAVEITEQIIRIAQQPNYFPENVV